MNLSVNFISNHEYCGTYVVSGIAYFSDTTEYEFQFGWEPSGGHHWISTGSFFTIDQSRTYKFNDAHNKALIKYLGYKPPVGLERNKFYNLKNQTYSVRHGKAYK